MFFGFILMGLEARSVSLTRDAVHVTYLPTDIIVVIPNYCSDSKLILSS